jgi:hypothetical protein
VLETSAVSFLAAWATLCFIFQGKGELGPGEKDPDRPFRVPFLFDLEQPHSCKRAATRHNRSGAGYKGVYVVLSAQTLSAVPLQLPLRAIRKKSNGDYASCCCWIVQTAACCSPAIVSATASTTAAVAQMNAKKPGTLLPSSSRLLVYHCCCCCSWCLPASKLAARLAAQPCSL